MAKRDTVEVLLVEDDPADVLMIQEALAQSAVAVHLHVAVDGEQALHFLRKTHEFAGAPRPSLVMLDLNLPRRGGLEVLAEMKTDSDLLALPVVILTTSHAEADIQRSYSMHANSYVTKPLDFDSFSAAVAQIASWFLEFIQLPASSLPACAAAVSADRGSRVLPTEDSVFLPLTDTPAVDTTGAGDAFTAGLIMALAHGADPRRAAHLAVAAAGATVGHPGGRPALAPKAIQDQLALVTGLPADSAGSSETTGKPHRWEVPMATAKQTKAARRNVTKAQKAAASKQTGHRADRPRPTGSGQITGEFHDQ